MGTGGLCGAGVGAETAGVDFTGTGGVFVGTGGLWGAGVGAVATGIDFTGAGRVFEGKGACAAGIVLGGICGVWANADDAMPKPTTAAVVPIKRLKIIVAFSA